MAKLEPPVKSTTKKSETAVIEKVIEKAAPKSPVEQVPPDEITPLQLKIPKAKKHEFKAYAAMRGTSMNALFVEMFDEYQRTHA